MNTGSLNERRHATGTRGLPTGGDATALDEASEGPGAVAQRKGDVLRAMVAAAKSHSATYRHHPSYLGRVWASLDRAGVPIAWRHRVASLVPARNGHQRRELEDQIRAVDGAVDIPYRIPNLLIEHVGAASTSSVGPSDSCGELAGNAFVVESFVDELAELSGACPVGYRRRMLTDSPPRPSRCSSWLSRGRTGMLR